MRLLVLCVTLAAAIGAEALIEHNPSVVLKENKMDIIIRKKLEELRIWMKLAEVVNFGQMNRNFYDEHTKTDLDAGFYNMHIFGLEDFVVNLVENKLATLTSTLVLTFPKLHLETGYNITGTSLGRKVKGEGTLSLEVSNLMNYFFVQLQYINKTLNYKDFKFNYNVEKIKFTEKGLSVDCLTERDLEDIVSSFLSWYFTYEKATVKSVITEYAPLWIQLLVNGETVESLEKDLESFNFNPKLFP